VTPPLCPYCGAAAKLVTGAEVYPHFDDLHDGGYWRCAPCDAHVGCHKGSEVPLGTLANKSTRRARMLAHAVFDPIWKRGGRDGRLRSKAYAWLARELGCRKGEPCHIASMDEETCRRVVALVRELPQDFRVPE